MSASRIEPDMTDNSCNNFGIPDGNARKWVAPLLASPWWSSLLSSASSCSYLYGAVLRYASSWSAPGGRRTVAGIHVSATAEAYPPAHCNRFPPLAASTMDPIWPAFYSNSCLLTPIAQPMSASKWLMWRRSAEIQRNTTQIFNHTSNMKTKTIFQKMSINGNIFVNTSFIQYFTHFYSTEIDNHWWPMHSIEQ